MATMNPSSMLAPGDFDTEGAALARKRAILDALVKQNMQGTAQGQMVSGHYVAPNWAENLATLGTAYLGKKRGEELDDKSADLTQRYQAGLGDAVKAYMTKMNGGTEEVPLQGPMPDGSAVQGVGQGEVPPDRHGAIVDAMTSQFKPLQALGAAEMSQLGKSSMTTKDYLSLTGYTAASKQAAQAANDPSLLRAEGKTHVVNNMLVREPGDDGTPVVTGDYGDKYGDVGQIGKAPDGKPILGQLDSRSGKAAFAPAGTTVNVDTGKKGADAFAVKGAEDAVKRLGEGQDLAKKAQQGFETFANAATQIKDVAGGTGANLVLGAKKLLSAFGVDDPSITSTEQVGAALGQAVLDNAKALGTGSGFSNTDREFLEKIVLGKITLDAKTLQRAVDIGMANNLNILHAHERMVNSTRDKKFADSDMVEGYRVEIPHFSLDGDRFDYQPKTGRFIVKTGAGSAPSPMPPGAVPPAAKPVASTKGAYTPQHEQRRQELIRMLGVQE